MWWGLRGVSGCECVGVGEHLCVGVLCACVRVGECVCVGCMHLCECFCALGWVREHVFGHV